MKLKPFHSEQLAYYDPLTQLPNAHFFDDVFQELLDHRIPFTLVVLQVSRFDEIQDAFGRALSKAFLKLLADRLRHVQGDHEQIFMVDRQTFKLLYQSKSRKEAERSLHVLEQCMKMPFAIGDHEISPEFHMGMAHYPGDGLDGDTLLHHAFRALMHARDVGVAYLLENPQSKSNLKRKLFLENELKKSLARNQLSLHFQPKVRAETNEVIGMEALMRWHHPVLGMISPGEFIPIAEENGFIIPMGEWLAHEACRFSKKLQNEFAIHIPVAINMSVKQFWQSGMIDTIKQALDSAEMSPEHLILEITESMTMNPESARQILLRLKELGVKLSIDDFGTGFSSLAHLKRYPIDELKIDKSFIDDILKGELGYKIVETIITLAHYLQIEVVAEGVESLDQLKCLRSLECDAIQGYYTAPPLNADDLVAYLLNLRGKLAINY